MTDEDGPEGEVSGPFRGGKIHVLAEKCSTCVFWPGNRMDLHKGRLKDLIDSNVEADSALTCHKTLPEWPGDAEPAVCRGFYDARRTTPLQIADRLGFIVFDPAP